MKNELKAIVNIMDCNILINTIILDFEIAEDSKGSQFIKFKANKAYKVVNGELVKCSSRELSRGNILMDMHMLGITLGSVWHSTQRSELEALKNGSKIPVYRISKRSMSAELVPIDKTILYNVKMPTQKPILKPTGDYLGDIFTNTVEIDIKTRVTLYDIMKTYKPEYFNLISLPCYDIRTLSTDTRDNVIYLMEKDVITFTLQPTDELKDVWVRQLRVGDKVTVTVEFYNGEDRLVFAFPTEKIIMGILKDIK